MIIGYVIKVPTGFVPYYLTADGTYVARRALAGVFSTAAAARKRADVLLAEEARAGKRNMSGPPEIEELR